MGSHVTAVFAPLAAGDVPVQGLVAVPAPAMMIVRLQIFMVPPGGFF